MEPKHKRAVLGRNLRLWQATSLEHIRVEIVHRAADSLPLIRNSIGGVALLRVNCQVVTERARAPHAQPEVVTACRVATKPADTIVRLAPNLPAEVQAVLDDVALEIVLELRILQLELSAQLAPRCHRHLCNVEIGRLVRHGDKGAAQIHLLLDADDRRRCGIDDYTILRVLEYPRVLGRRVERCKEGTPGHPCADRLLKQLTKALRLAIETAVCIERGTSMETPYLVVLVIEAANHYTIDEALNHETLRRGRCRHRLARLALDRRNADRHILDNIPYDGAKCTDMIDGEIALTLDVANQCKRLLRCRVVIYTEITASLAG